jgi:nucleoside 2-deoxyribosyltransferase
MKKIYIAGPDVFDKNALEIFEIYKTLCELYGFKGLVPFDADIHYGLDNDILRSKIYSANIEMIREADIVIADMNNFRHGEQDSGTIFEIGFAVALDKDVYIHSTDNRSLLEKTKEEDDKVYFEDGFWYDSNHMMIEDMGANYNLMISESTIFVHGTFEDVLKKIVEE